MCLFLNLILCCNPVHVPGFSSVVFFFFFILTNVSAIRIASFWNIILSLPFQRWFLAFIGWFSWYLEAEVQWHSFLVLHRAENAHLHFFFLLNHLLCGFVVASNVLIMSIGQNIYCDIHMKLMFCPAISRWTGLQQWTNRIQF